jgi:hypothetical protein
MKLKDVRLTILCVCVIASIPFSFALGQVQHSNKNSETIDKLRDRDLQPEKIMDFVELRQGMIVGEAGASYGYFTFKMRKYDHRPSAHSLYIIGKWNCGSTG